MNRVVCVCVCVNVLAYAWVDVCGRVDGVWEWVDI